jgi:hypothetical protein
VINVSDRPWCFAARSDQILVDQVSNEFSTGLEVLLNYLVICFLVFVLCTPSCFSSRGSVKVCFSSCFSFACIVQVGFI